MSADVCGTCGRLVLPADVDEVEAAIRTLRMLAEDGEPRAMAALGVPCEPDCDCPNAPEAHLSTCFHMRPTCPRCGVRPVQNNGQGSCDTCAQA